MKYLQSKPILKKNKKFCNPHIQKIKRRIWHVLLWKMGYYNESLKRAPPPVDFSYPFRNCFTLNRPSVVWINHCTFFLQTSKYSILTDPIWDKFCSPFPIKSLKRKHLPGLKLEEIQNVDLVLISHNHYDHLEKKTIKFLHQKFPKIHWVVPINLSGWFKKHGILHAHELNWWQELELQGVKITALPSQHFSGRVIFDTNKTLWNGYAIEFKDERKKAYFSGDTGYNEVDFRSIGQFFNGFDLSLIPIGTYCPRNFMKTVHINPDEAVKIHQEVRSKFSIGMHWKTFQLSDEPMNLPPFDLYQAMQKASLAPQEFIAVDPGIFLNW